MTKLKVMSTHNVNYCSQRRNKKMMEETNKEFARQVKADLLGLVTKINKQIKGTEQYAYDTDCDQLRKIREDIITSIDTISHLEYKEMI